MAALESARKWNDELHRALCGQAPLSSTTATLDPVKVMRQVVGRISAELDGTDIGLRLLAPAELTAVMGEPSMLESVLLRLLRHRVAEPQVDGRITLSARIIGEDEGRSVLFSVVDRPVTSDPQAEVDDGKLGQRESEPRAVRATVAALGGRIFTLDEPAVGRVTAIRLNLVPSE